MRVEGNHRAALRREPRARRPPPAGRRLPAARLRHAPARGATRCSTSCTASRAGPARSSRPCAWASSRTSSSRCTEGAADDPRDAVRLDRARSPTRSGRTASGRTTAGRRSSPATSSGRSTPATGRSARRAGAALAGLSEGGYGALNIGLHHPGEFRVLESWSGYEQADDIGSIFGHRRGAARREHAARHARAPPRAALRRAHTFVWFYSGTDDQFRSQNEAFARALDARSRRRTASSSSAAATTGRSGAATPRAPTSPRSRRLGQCVGPPPLRSSLLAVAVAATGWLYLVRPRPARARGSARRCRSTSSSRHSSAPLVWFVARLGRRPGSLLGAVRALGPRRAADRGARCSRLGVGLWVYLTDGALDRRRPADPGARRARRRRAACTPSTSPAALVGARRRTASTEPRSRGGRGAVVVAWLVAAAGALERAARRPARRRRGPPPLAHAGRRRPAGPRGRACSPAIALLARRARSRAPAAARLAGRGLGRRALDRAARAARPQRRHARLGGRPARCSSRAGTTSTARRRATRRVALAAGRGRRGRDPRLRRRGALGQPHRRRPAVHAPASPCARSRGGLLGLQPPRLAAPRRRVRRLVPALAAPARRRGDRLGRRRLARSLALPGAAGGARARSSRDDARLDVGRRHARAVRAARRQVVLLRPGRALVPRLPRRRRRRDRLRRPDRRPRRPRRAHRVVRRASRTAATGASRSSARPSAASTLYRARTGCTRSTTATRRSSTRRAFSLEGRAIRKVRQSVHRLEHAGYDGACPAPERARRRAARASSRRSRDAWRGDAARARLRDGARRALLARRRRRRLRRRLRPGRATPAGFLHFAVSRAGGALSLSSMPRLRDDAERLQRVADLRGDRLGARRTATSTSR